MQETQQEEPAAPPSREQGGCQPDSSTRARWGRRVRRWAVGVAATVLVALLPFALDRLLHANQVLRGVWVSGVSLSGLGAADAKQAVQQLAERLRSAPLQVRVDGGLFQLEPPTVDYQVDVDGTIARALAAGREGGLLAQLAWWVRRWTSPQDLEVTAQLDRDVLARTLSEWERAAIKDPPFPGGVRADGTTVVKELPRVGRRIDRGPAEQQLLVGLGRHNRAVVDLALIEVRPRLRADAVEAAAARARQLLAGPLELCSPDGEIRVAFTVSELAQALETRVGDGAIPTLEVGFSSDALNRKISTLGPKVERPPRAASFEIGQHERVFVVPSEPGVSVRAELLPAALLEAAAAAGRVGILPVDRSARPELETDAARKLGVRELVSTFTTHHPCCRPRVDNIHRIADLLDGTVVRPGQTFSVNEAVGPRTRKNGFVPAPTIEEGEMVDTVGGGISQFATTLFNAVFYGGYDIIERQPHTYYFSRYPEGHEATLSYPEPDLIFRNDTSAGLLIKCDYGGTFIRVKLYGDNGGRKIRAKVSRRYDVRDAPIEYVPNAELDPEKEEVLEAGQLGWTVTVARILTFADGTTKEEQREVTYNPRVRRIEVHPCRIPEGAEGYTGEQCPEPPDEEGEPEATEEELLLDDAHQPPDPDAPAAEAPPPQP